MNPDVILEAANAVMPFGKHSGSKLLHIPEPYLVWLNKQGLPQGKLGQQLALIYEVKLNGLESLFITHNGSIQFQSNKPFKEGK